MVDSSPTPTPTPAPTPTDSPAPAPATAPAPGPATAPPTAPGQLPAGFNAPTTRLAVAALVLGIAGCVLPVIGLAGVGLGWAALVRIRRHPEAYRGKGMAIGGLCAGGIGFIVATMFWMFIVVGIAAAHSSVQVARTNVAMMSIQRNAVSYAKQNDGYPAHISLLLVDSGFPVHYNVGPDAPHPVLAPGDVVVGTFDFADYQPTVESEEAIRTAVEELDDSVPWYRFGDTWFLRLEGPMQDGSVVFAWQYDEVTGHVRAVMDDGSMQSGLSWDGFWEDYAEEVRRRALPEFTAPPAPDASGEIPGDTSGGD